MSQKRVALVRIVNRTGRTIDKVTVVHKHSDDYRDEHTWTDVGVGKATDAFAVRYLTGPATAGTDWWSVHWNHGQTHCVTNLNHFRALYDFIGGGSTRSAEQGRTTGMRDLVADLEKTDGFMNHPLGPPDAGQITDIVLGGNGKVTFRSKSGVSDAAYQSTDLPGFGPTAAPAIRSPRARRRGASTRRRVSSNGRAVQYGGNRRRRA